METSSNGRVQDLQPLRQRVHGRCHFSGKLEIDIHKRKKWFEQNISLESSVCDLPISVGETKEIDPYCSPFCSGTSSDLNEPTSTIGEVASKRPKTFSKMTKIIGSKPESRLANVKKGNDLRENATIDNKERMEKIHSIWNDSISLELQYGMEIAELLEAYCRRRNLSEIIIV